MTWENIFKAMQAMKQGMFDIGAGTVKFTIYNGRTEVGQGRLGRLQVVPGRGFTIVFGPGVAVPRVISPAILPAILPAINPADQPLNPRSIS